MGTPTLKVEIDFVSAPLSATNTWTDVSTYARTVSLRRGRDHELNRSQAGTATITLSNRDRRFDPLNASSPYAPNVIPMRQIRISAVWSAVTYPLFTGYIEDWAQDWLPRPIYASGDAQVSIRAVDAFKILSLYQMAGSGLYRNVVLASQPDEYWPLEEAAGSATVAGVVPTVGYAGNFASPPNTPLTVNAAQCTLGVTPSPLSGPAGVADLPAVGNTPLRKASGVTQWADENSQAYYRFSVDFWIKADTLPAGNAPGLFSIAGAGNEFGILTIYLNQTGQIVACWREHGSGNPGNGRCTASNNGAIATGAWHHVGVTKSGNVIFYYVDGQSVGVAGYPGASAYGSIVSGAAVAINIGAFEGEAQYFDGKIAHVAVYAERELQQTDYAAHASATLQGSSSGSTDTAGQQIGFLLDAVGWPTAKRSLDTGDARMSILSVSGSVLEGILAIGEDSEQGLVQITNDGNVLFHSRSSVLGHGTTDATFSDTGTNIKYQDMEVQYDDTDLYTKIIAQGNYDGAAEQQASGATVTTYGPRVLSKTGLHLQDDTEVANFASYLASRYDTPALRITRVSAPGANDNFWPTLLSIDTHHAKVAIVRTPPGGGSAISKNAHVEGVAWEIDPANGRWEWAFSLVPAFEEEFWVLGVSAFDAETILAW